MARRMEWADVAVAAGGITCWELACLGVPAILLVIVPDQQPNAEGLDASGAAENAGDAAQATADELAKRLDALCRDPERRRDMSERARHVVDGAGAERVVSFLARLAVTGVADADLTIRDAGPGDVMRLWHLSNDPVTRRNSFAPEPIPLRRHRDWLAQQLASPDRCFLLMELAGVFAARALYRRAEDERDALTVDFAVVPALRGRGLGRRMLSLTWERACRALGARRVRGLVLPENAASLTAFERAGFTRVSDVDHQGRRCAVFERRCA
jgi:RimJ/RimL family protein N-acetyltransferase